MKKQGKVARVSQFRSASSESGDRVRSTLLQLARTQLVKHVEPVGERESRTKFETRVFAALRGVEIAKKRKGIDRKRVGSSKGL